MKLQISQERGLIVALSDASRDVERDILGIAGKKNIGSKIELVRLRQARIVIKEALFLLMSKTGQTIETGRLRAAITALEVSFAWDRPLLRRVFTANQSLIVIRNLRRTAIHGLEAALARTAVTRIPLSASVYRTQVLADGFVDRKIDSALARGISWKTFSGEIAGFIDPATPGGVSYAAKRLARTEINNAYHQVTIQHNEDKPWNKSMVWRLSGSHPKIDICNVIAENGPYDPSGVPSKPHPQCLCVTYPQTVSPNEFVKRFKLGNYDEWMRENYGNFRVV